MTLPGRIPRAMPPKQSSFRTPSPNGDSPVTTSGSPVPSTFAFHSNHHRMHHHSSFSSSPGALTPSSDKLAMMVKPTEEEQVALEAIRRLGDEIDTAIALEFLRGPHFGDFGTTSSASDRGLPPAAVSILKLWFLVHQSDPYPTKEEKERLMKETGLSTIQLKNWFSNIRKRHWHPIRTGSRRPRSHVEYVLLYGASAQAPTSSPESPNDGDDGESLMESDLERPQKMARRLSIRD